MNLPKKPPVRSRAQPLAGGDPWEGWQERWRIPGICFALAVLTCFVFGQTTRYGFVNYDDDLFVAGNPHIAAGFSLKNVAWFLTHADCSMYIPVTMPLWQVGLAGIFLAAISAVAWMERRRRPWLLMGWWWYLGNALIKAGKTDEAIAQCRQALQINPNDAQACVILGRALSKKGDADGAIAQFRRALEINPQLEAAQRNLDSLLRQAASGTHAAQ